MRISERFRTVFFSVAVLAISVTPAYSYAQSTLELHEGFTRYWQEDLVFLKKINAEKDNHRAAALVNEMKEEMLPKLQKELQVTDEWKKNHSQQEIRENQKWTTNNDLQQQVGSLQTNTMINSSRQGGELATAFQNYMKAMSMLMKKPRG